MKLALTRSDRRVRWLRPPHDFGGCAIFLFPENLWFFKFSRYYLAAPRLNSGNIEGGFV